jgi:hypothetical protein
LGDLGNSVPRSEAFREQDAIAHRAQAMTLDGEILPDRPEAGQEGLCSLRRPKTPHPAFTFPCRLMIILCTVVDAGRRFDEYMFDISQFDGGDEFKGLPLRELLAEKRPGRHLYVCGPRGLIDAVLNQPAAMDWASGHVHYELFGGAFALTGDMLSMSNF